MPLKSSPVAKNEGDVFRTGAVENPAPIDVTRFGESDGAVGAIVDHLRGPLIGAGLQIVDADTSLAREHRQGAGVLLLAPPDQASDGIDVLGTKPADD
jgi:hypothetical protein